jgi:DNA modification methylase
VKIVTLSRKPPAEGSTTQNVLVHAAGVLNIDACRVGTSKNVPASPSRTRGNALSGSVDGSLRRETGDEDGHNPHVGRWPANVILRHRSICRRAGTSMAPGYTINRWKDGAKPFGGGAGHEYESEQLPEERVAVWECRDGCPVRELGAHSGWQISGRHGGSPGGFGAAQLFGDGSRTLDLSGGYMDAGTAARYFKQTQQETEMTDIPDELWDYLTTMISPPKDCDPVLIVSDDLEDLDWAAYEDASVHGMITVGNPEEHMEQIDRVLKPGAHLLLIGPDDEPTGHTGACAVEDYGFEIRDAIALLDRPDDFHYVAKASSSERNAGLPDFEETVEIDRAFPKDGVDLEDLYEQISEMVNEQWLENWQEEGVPPTELSDDVMEHFEVRKIEDTKTHKNNHPTVKAVGVMERLLQDVPKDGPVVDPFMGSGTTGVACLRTGHEFIGIEQDAEYIKIADQRVRHWDRAVAAWNGAEITSEAEIDDDDDQVSLGDFFGG